MKPYKFEPYLKTTLWGGYQIAPFKGIFTAQPNVGESWENPRRATSMSASL